MGRLLLSLLVLSACVPSAGESSDVSGALQGGQVDEGDPAVGMLWLAGGGTCTSTLIAPSVVLTAAHCVTHPVEAFYTGTGDFLMTQGPPTSMVRHDVDDTRAYPGYVTNNDCPDPYFDLGLVHLAEPITDIKPLALASEAPTIGEVCRAIGYGKHTVSPDSPLYGVGQKWAGTIVIHGIGEKNVEVVAGTAIGDKGDSGGPLLCGGLIAGAYSCDHPSIGLWSYGRIDDPLGWAASAVADWSAQAPRTDTNQ